MLFLKGFVGYPRDNKQPQNPPLAPNPQTQTKEKQGKEAVLGRRAFQIGVNLVASIAKTTISLKEDNICFIVFFSIKLVFYSIP